MTKIRIGGVPEHFNLPWILATEEGAFADLGVDVEWVNFSGGTGAIMKALAAGEIHMSTPLTEGAVTAIANGNPSRVLKIFVDSPLLWGIHAAGTTTAESVADLVGGRIAISRIGSGSELMGYLLGAQQGWELTADDFVIVGNLDGALDALPAGDAEIFLWNKSMTQPHVDDGTLARVGVLPTPWPSFASAAGTDFLAEHHELAHAMTEIAAVRAVEFAADNHAAEIVMERFGLLRPGAEEWLAQIRWTAPAGNFGESGESGASIDSGESGLETTIEAAALRMFELGRIAAMPAISDLIG